MRALLLAGLLCMGLAQGGLAHETTRSYVTVARDGAEVTAEVRIAFRDIEVAVWIDEDLDGQITWGEATRRIDAVSDYVTDALTFDAGGRCQMARSGFGPSMNGGTAYLDLTFRGQCPDPQAALRATSRLFAEFDPDHRLFLTANLGGATTTTLLGAAASTAVLSADSGGVARIFASYLREGVRHLLKGADHLVFLLLLVLPAVAARVRPRRAGLAVLAAVTGFTVAHALTLTAAAISILRPPSVMIEVLIAISIVITAIDNLRPFIPAPRAAVAAGFGLIHGFGFATALGALPLSGFSFAAALLGFNLGIETAQIAVVAVVLPAIYVLRPGRAFLRIGSLGAMGAGLYWVAERLAV